MMTLTRHIDADLAYPVMAFRTTGDIEYFDDECWFTDFQAWVLDGGILIGLELVDNDGEQWFVRAVDVHEPPPLRWWHIVRRLLIPTFRADLWLEKGSHVAFDVVRQRVCDRSVIDFRAMGEDDEQIRELLDSLADTQTNGDISHILGLADWGGFHP
ncbi:MULTISPECIES: hypothetical protein [unclassified Sphingomonas]|uniref:hypothetical protein n=1 Tax=unclassified Sphingomonas TaxID=196159 RepID=UPI0006F6352A|nr:MULTISPECIES: hypothetical protein [unclassified Sphingomonas]KQX25557.1 hypothetical protein ASD17_22575 [Sphingomonas sp. Root1294]KQY66547.1 hypothetical protein ASD39_12375 [Sphingomonas sp. Root50]KRB90131.1 hypothetical protein ASE22_14575 [Sphingomonas sp. Root720]